MKNKFNRTDLICVFCGGNDVVARDSWDEGDKKTHFCRNRQCRDRDDMGYQEPNLIPPPMPPTPPCRACNRTKEVICYPDDHSLTICPDCCAKAEHPDGESGHQFTYCRYERDHECNYCGVLRRCTDYRGD